jgi:threonine dehydratase
MLTRVPDRPGSLARLLVLVGESGANLIHVDHLREGIDLHVRETGVQLTIETRGREHADAVLARVRESGYDLDVMGDEPVSPAKPPA